VGRIRFELIAFRLKVESTSSGGTGPKLGAPGWNRTNCLWIKNPPLILMSFKRVTFWSLSLVSSQAPADYEPAALPLS
jgi:hypothetical protein